MEDTVLCCGCLCASRRMVVVEKYWLKQSFLQIINEIPLPLPKGELSLCWECEYLLNRFTSFRNQVKECYKLFNYYATENLSAFHIQRAPRLTICKLSQSTALKYIKDELSDITGHIKEEENLINEADNLSIYSDNPNDDTPLVSTGHIKKEESPIKEKNNLSTYSDNLNDDTPLAEIKVKKKRKKFTIKVKKKTKERKVKTKEVELIREIELNADEIREERFLFASRDEYVNGMFRCEKCIVSFPNADDLQDHLNIKHDPNKTQFKCNVCVCTFSTETSLNYHLRKHSRRYECTACGEKMRSKGAATRHYAITHGLSPELYYNLDKPYMNGRQTEALEPNESTNQDAVFPCDVCDKSFRWKTSLRKHMETHRIETGQKRKPFCEPCRLSFATSSNLQKHVSKSSKHQIKLKLWKLNESLPTDTTSPEKHQAHIERIKCSVNASRQTFPCPHCDKRFQWRGNLARHVLSHKARADGELVCIPCNRTFSSLATYKQHMEASRKHVSEDDFKYVCSDCGKRFANKTRLKDHINWEHLKIFAYTCDACQKVFKSQTSMSLHKQQVHNKGNLEHLCDHCGKPFLNKAKLKNHIIALHTTTTPYKCPICCARFNWQSCLSRHTRRVHRTREGPPVSDVTA